MAYPISDESTHLREDGTSGFIPVPTTCGLSRGNWCPTPLKLLTILLVVLYLAVNRAFQPNLASSFKHEGKAKKAISDRQVLYDKEGVFEDDPNYKKEKMKLSLWLVPPGGESNSKDNKNGLYGRTIQVIDELSSQFDGPKFIPHITIVGGIEVDSEEDAHALSKRLEEGLAYFGTVQCTFKDILQEPTCWNQALIIEMARSESFNQLCKLSRQILAMEQGGDCVTFPPPARVPHMSLFYGEFPQGDDSDSTTTVDYGTRIFGDMKSYEAHRVMLWKTDPSSVEGVQKWKALTDISLL